MIYFVTNNLEIFENEYYKIISPKDALQFLAPLKVVGLDTETSGLDPWTKELKSLQLGNRDFQVVIDCLSIDIRTFKDYLESDRTFLGWNLKFDLKFLYRKGIYPKKVYDGFLAEKLLYLGYPAGMIPMSLKECARKYIGVEMDKSVRGKIIHSGFTTDVIQYAARDVEFLEDIILKQWEELKKKDLTTAIGVENKFVIPLAYTEYCGIKLDDRAWKEKMRKDNERLSKATNALNDWMVEHFKDNRKYVIYDMIGDLFSGFHPGYICTINWSSSKQVIPLFKELGFNLQVKDKIKGGIKDSVDAKVIKPQKDISSIAPLYLDYKEAQKVCSTYGQNFIDQINPVSHRIHTNYQQMGADTTRITSGGKDKGNNVEYINLLNLPSDEETRACFVAEKGNKWISIDYSGQESALLASIADDKAMIHELDEGSKDIHSLVAYMSYPSKIPRGTPIKEIKKYYHSLRSDAKGIEFAINKTTCFL